MIGEARYPLCEGCRGGSESLVFVEGCSSVSGDVMDE